MQTTNDVGFTVHILCLSSKTENCHQLITQKSGIKNIPSKHKLTMFPLEQ